MRMRVRVLGIQRVRDVVEGGVMYVVTFGRMVDLNEEIRARVTQAGQTVPPGAQDLGINSIVLVVPFPEGPPYLLDSEWELTVRPDGSVLLDPPPR